MSKKRHTAEEIVAKLRQVDVLTAQAVREWVTAVGARTAYIEPGSPWENGYCESFNSKLRDELLKGEIFYTLKEAQIVSEKWRRHYNTVRPHSSLGYKPPAPEVVLWPAAQPQPAPAATPTVAPRPIMH
jgi:putative transposase